MAGRKKSPSEYSTNASTMRNLKRRGQLSGEAAQQNLDRIATNTAYSKFWKKNFMPVSQHLLAAAKDESERAHLEKELQLQSKNVATAIR